MRTEPRFDLRYDPSDDVFDEMDRWIMETANKILDYLSAHRTEIEAYIWICRRGIESALTWGELFATYPDAKPKESELSKLFDKGHSGSTWALVRSRVAHLLFVYEPGEANIQVIS